MYVYVVNISKIPFFIFENGNQCTSNYDKKQLNKRITKDYIFKYCNWWQVMFTLISLSLSACSFFYKAFYEDSSNVNFLSSVPDLWWYHLRAPWNSLKQEQSNKHVTFFQSMAHEEVLFNLLSSILFCISIGKLAIYQYPYG